MGNEYLTMKRINKNVPDRSTEEKIKNAARKVFINKGFAATRTRDIAEEAGINLALLNYYFRSKEKLFNEVMLEKMQQFFGILLPIINDTSTRLESKIESIVSNYIDLLSEHPDLPLFVLGALKNHSEKIAEILPVRKINNKMSFIIQLKEKRPDINPIHFLMNILGMTVFPFVGKPAFEMISAINKNQFDIILQERKKLIPIWMKAMLKAK